MKKIDKRKLTKKFIYENAKETNILPEPCHYEVEIEGVKLLVEFREDQGYYCPVRDISDDDVNTIYIYFPEIWYDDISYDHRPNKIIRF